MELNCSNCAFNGTKDSFNNKMLTIEKNYCREIEDAYGITDYFTQHCVRYMQFYGHLPYEAFTSYGFGCKNKRAIHIMSCDKLDNCSRCFFKCPEMQGNENMFSNIGIGCKTKNAVIISGCTGINTEAEKHE